MHSETLKTYCLVLGCWGFFNRLFPKPKYQSVQPRFSVQIVAVQCLVPHALLCRVKCQHSHPSVFSGGFFCNRLHSRNEAFGVAGPKDCSSIGG